MLCSQTVPPPVQRAYGEEMRNIHLFLDRANLISPVLEGQLGRLEATTMVPIQWAELTELALLSPSSLFQPDFVGLVGLRRVLEDLVGHFKDYVVESQSVLYFYDCVHYHAS